MAITRQQALDCFASDDLIGIGMEAAAVRRRLHPEGVVSYVVQARVSSLAEATRAVDQGASALVLAQQSAIKDYEELARVILTAHPDVCIKAATAFELVTQDRLPEALARLREAGVSAIAGDGPGTLPLTEWERVHRAVHTAGFRSRALLVFGAGESDAHRLDWLERIRDIQASASGFTSFSAIVAPAANGRELDEATAVEYLKTLAVARIVLDNVENVEADLASQGLKVLQMALRFGANDAGAVTAFGPGNEEEVRRLIRDAGFQPSQRDGLYTRCLLA